MPIFEYQCKKCGTKFEELITGDRNVSVPCPTCGEKKTEKQMSAIGGIAMGKTSGCGSSCATSACANTSMCSSGMCPHAG